ncbi:hypothetical protein AAFF_G00331570 [Aldrovandia affinis]|uniref:Uncharacterized protein n=1 Tax=Aldrovandia affinis TaxID=143900 RepID=A0AAD7SLS3_9TELE|nr:hypothetical protein AAFF_G00331570 [Aldrovandia affinis]
MLSAISSSPAARPHQSSRKRLRSRVGFLRARTRDTAALQRESCCPEERTPEEQVLQPALWSERRPGGWGAFEPSDTTARAKTARKGDRERGFHGIEPKRFAVGVTGHRLPM